MALESFNGAATQYWEVLAIPGLGAGNWTLLNLDNGLYAFASSAVPGAPLISWGESFHVWTTPITGSPYYK